MNFVELHVSILLKVEVEGDDFGYLAEKISKQSIEDATWVLLTFYSKMWEERDEFKKDLLGRKEPKLGNWENSQPTHTERKKKNQNEKACSKKNTKGMAGQTFDKEILGVTHKLDQLSQHKLGIEMVLYQQKHCQMGLEDKRKWDKIK